MSTNLRLHNAGRQFAWVVLPCLAILMFAAVPRANEERAVAGTRPSPDTPKELEDSVAIGEKQLAVKRAGVKVADAQTVLAAANLKLLETNVQTAKANVPAAEASLVQREQQAENKAVTTALVHEARARLDSARVLVEEAEGKVLLGRAEVGISEARRELAQAELDESELSLKQLRARLEAAK